MIGRLLHKSDFERVLAVPPCSRSAHFALHHLKGRPWTGRRLGQAELCTNGALISDGLVDNSVSGHWLGCVMPKRHAAHAVSRNLFRRQARAAMHEHASRLPAGMWLVRLRQPFARTEFRSADSPQLRAAAAAELERLFRRVAL